MEAEVVVGDCVESVEYWIRCVAMGATEAEKKEEAMGADVQAELIKQTNQLGVCQVSPPRR